jgi:DNA-binding winged helix-turn-helix (wHTH) protein
MLKGGAVVDLERREVRLNGSHHRLKGVPHKLLQYFLENPHRAVSREELLNSHIWDNSVCSPKAAEQGRAIDMAVTRLRRIIEADPANPQIITVVHGTGWILAKDAVLLKKKEQSSPAFPRHLLSVQGRIRIAMVQAAALFTGKAMLLFCYSKYCGDCHRIQNNIF